MSDVRNGSKADLQVHPPIGPKNENHLQDCDGRESNKCGRIEPTVGVAGEHVRHQDEPSGKGNAYGQRLHPLWLNSPVAIPKGR